MTSFKETEFMRKLILTLTLALLTSITYGSENIATVIFENLTNKEFILGKFTISNFNKTIEITKAESFNITLPEKGKYQFSFVSEDFTSYTFYPVIINNKKNTIIIRLKEKTEINSDGIYSFPMNMETDLTDEEIELRISDGSLNFIMHGIDSSIPKEYIKFKEKYGI